MKKWVSLVAILTFFDPAGVQSGRGGGKGQGIGYNDGRGGGDGRQGKGEEKGGYL